ncbi:uncharacterized protein OCT59_013128 [Rhizophagus irregularis]|uniref:uncharacterized protein n=1 Tax=Rhizophagus irregularis TaxID=588596 RepID=UPI00332F3CBC|nr:hypothetical protein OCT59_013128 [Rhizophagus irregularis]
MEFYRGLSIDFSHLLDESDDYDVIIYAAHEVFDVILKYIYSGTADLLAQEGGIILNLLTASDDDYWDKVRPFSQILPSDLHEVLLQYYCKRAKWIDRKEGSETNLEKSKYDFNRVLCGSISGFTAANFHKKCDNQGPTLVVIKVKETGEIIGGYNPISWRGLNNNLDGGWMSAAAPSWTVSNRHRPSTFGSFSRSTYEVGPYQSTLNSFIFSLGDGKDLSKAKISRILQDNMSTAVFSSPRHGPCFGQNDLRMNDNFNEAETCTCQCYDYESEITENHNFSVEEYEVFQVVNKDGQETSNQASTSPMQQMHPPRPELTNYPTAWGEFMHF